MKTKFPLLIGLALLLASTVEAQNASWLRYTVKGEQFSVTLPAEPSMKKSDVFVMRGATADHAGVQPFFSSVVLGKKQEGIYVLEGGIAVEAGQTIFKGAEVSTKVRLLSKPEPSYTDEAKQRGRVGVVVLKAVFSSSGKVTNVRVVQGIPDGSTERAIAAARKIKFVPATKEGKSVSMWMQLEYYFNLF